MDSIMGFMEAVKHVFKNYATFEGRARRSEYWYFVLFNNLLSIAFLVLYYGFLAGGLVGYFSYYGSAYSGASLGFAEFINVLFVMYGFACIVPSLAVTCRRLHDIGKPGTYMLFRLIPVAGSILMLVWLLQDSDPYDNRYGPCTKSFAYIPPRNDPQQVIYAQQVINTPQYINKQQYIYPTQKLVGGNGRGARLVGVAGEMRGRSFMIPDRMMIGRGNGCNILFTSNGVSRQHCELRYNRGRLYIRDLGSSNGTVINRKNRLEPNKLVALRPGDWISVGSNRNILQVM